MEENRAIQREIVEMTRETRDLLREVQSNTHLISGLTNNLGREIEDRVRAVLHTIWVYKIDSFIRFVSQTGIFHVLFALFFLTLTILIP